MRISYDQEDLVVSKHQRRLKPRNKRLNDILVAKSKHSGAHRDKREKHEDREIRKAIKEQS